MTTGPAAQYMSHVVTQCPHCAGDHTFILALESRPPPETGVVLFGGPGAQAREFAFTCPNTHKLITRQIADPPGGKLIGPVDAIPTSGAAALAASEPAMESAIDAGEMSEWVKSSRSTAYEFCKTMLTTSAAAIPAYFALLKYIGVENIQGSFLARAGIVPPVLFLATSMIFVLALQPRFVSLKPSEFDAFRAARLGRLNIFINVGTALFGIGVLLSIALFFRAITAAS